MKFKISFLLSIFFCFHSLLGMSVLDLRSSGGEFQMNFLLHDAADCGDVEKVKKLVSQKYDVNQKDPKGNTPLHYAVMGGFKIDEIERHVKIVKMLRDAGAVEIANAMGETPRRVLEEFYKDQLMNVDEEALSNALENKKESRTSWMIAAFMKRLRSIKRKFQNLRAALRIRVFKI